jgi:hypothetical protein
MRRGMQRRTDMGPVRKAVEIVLSTMVGIGIVAVAVFLLRPHPAAPPPLAQSPSGTPGSTGTVLPGGAPSKDHGIGTPVGAPSAGGAASGPDRPASGATTSTDDASAPGASPGAGSSPTSTGSGSSSASAPPPSSSAGAGLVGGVTGVVGGVTGAVGGVVGGLLGGLIGTGSGQ